MKTLVNRRLHFQAATTHAIDDRSDTLPLTEESDVDALNRPVVQSLPHGPIHPSQRPTASLISNIQGNEVLIKISDGAVITFLRRYPPDGLKAFLHQHLSTSPNPTISSIQLQRAMLLKTGDMSLLMQSSEDRDALRSHPEHLEHALLTAKVLTPSYKVLMKGIQPFLVELVDQADETEFIMRLQEEN